MKDDSFFERIEKIKDRLYRIAYSYFSSESKAVDIVDDAIYHAYLKKRQLKKEEYMETWLVRILINRCKNEYRRDKKYVGFYEIADEIEDSTAYSELEDIPLKDAISRIPEKYRQIIVLKFFGGYTLAEVGSMLEIPQGTVATRYKKALELLRIEISD